MSDEWLADFAAAPVTSLAVLPPAGFAGAAAPAAAMPVLPRPSYDAILAATSQHAPFDSRSYALAVSFPAASATVPETATSPLSPVLRSPPLSSFGPDADMPEIVRGAREMSALAPAPRAAATQRVAALERDLAALHRSYERLADVHRRTWAGLVENSALKTDG